MKILSAAQSGRLAEQATAEHLISQGYEICAANYQVHQIGEIDLIARRNGNLTIVEVKARRRAEAFGGLPAAITPGKLRKMRRTAWCYLKETRQMNCDVTFLAALVQLDPKGYVADLSIIPIEWQ